jgi:hypothetical protein
MNTRALAVSVCLFLAAVTSGYLAAQQPGVAVKISSPQDEETIHDNTGRVPVTVAITGGEPLVAGIGAVPEPEEMTHGRVQPPHLRTR